MLAGVRGWQKELSNESEPPWLLKHRCPAFLDVAREDVVQEQDDALLWRGLRLKVGASRHVLQSCGYLFRNELNKVVSVDDKEKGC